MADELTQTANEFRIEKLRHPVSVVFCGGGRVAGEMFLAARARYRAGAEQPLDVLNDETRFFPLRASSGETVLVAKGQIAVLEAELPPPDDDPRATLGTGLGAEVTLVDGAVHDGMVYPDTTRERPRLLDFLNAFPGAFIPVYAPDRMYLINRLQIAHVRAVT